MKRVFRIDARKCGTCGGERLWIAAHNSTAEASGEAIAKILDHLDLPSARVQSALPRASLQLEFGFEGC